MTSKLIAFSQETGLLLLGIGFGLILSGTDFFETDTSLTPTVVGLFAIIAGNALRLFRTKEEKEKEIKKKRERYERIKDRFGIERVILARKASGIGTLCFFCVAMVIMFSGSMNYVWPLIFLIVLCITTLVLTSDPDGQIN